MFDERPTEVQTSFYEKMYPGSGLKAETERPEPTKEQQQPTGQSNTMIQVVQSSKGLVPVLGLMLFLIIILFVMVVSKEFN